MPDPETAQCAHCGATPGPILFARVNASTQVVCNFCGAAGPLESTEADAIAVWNRRTPLQPDRTDWSTPLTPELHERITELEAQVADSHGPLQHQVAQLNARIIDLNGTIDAERAAHQKLQSAYTGACARISALLKNGDTHA